MYVDYPLNCGPLQILSEDQFLINQPCRVLLVEASSMENEDGKHTMKVDVVSATENESVLSRQPSSSKCSCLCSPTTHAGSFRYRLHRAPGLQRTKSMDSTRSSPPATVPTHVCSD